MRQNIVSIEKENSIVHISVIASLSVFFLSSFSFFHVFSYLGICLYSALTSVMQMSVTKSWQSLSPANKMKTSSSPWSLTHFGERGYHSFPPISHPRCSDVLASGASLDYLDWSKKKQQQQQLSTNNPAKAGAGWSINVTSLLRVRNSTFVTSILAFASSSVSLSARVSSLRVEKKQLSRCLAVG